MKAIQRSGKLILKVSKKDISDMEKMGKESGWDKTAALEGDVAQAISDLENYLRLLKEALSTGNSELIPVHLRAFDRNCQVVRNIMSNIINRQLPESQMNSTQ